MQSYGNFPKKGVQFQWSPLKFEILARAPLLHGKEKVLTAKNWYYLKNQKRLFAPLHVIWYKDKLINDRVILVK